jgi:hypothetical protein
MFTQLPQNYRVLQIEMKNPGDVAVKARHLKSFQRLLTRSVTRNVNRRHSDLKTTMVCMHPDVSRIKDVIDRRNESKLLQ